MELKMPYWPLKIHNQTIVAADDRRDGRQVEDGAVEGQTADAHIQRQRHEEIEDEMDGQAQQHHIEGIAQRNPEDPVLQQILIVARPYGPRRAQNVVVMETVIQGLPYGPAREAEDAYDGGRNEKETRPEVALCARQELAFHWPRTFGKGKTVAVLGRERVRRRAELQAIAHGR